MLGGSFTLDGKTCVLLYASDDPMLKEFLASKYSSLNISDYINYTTKSSLGVECIDIKHKPHTTYYKVVDHKKWMFTVLRLGIVLS